MYHQIVREMREAVAWRDGMGLLADRLDDDGLESTVYRQYLAMLADYNDQTFVRMSELRAAQMLWEAQTQHTMFARTVETGGFTLEHPVGEFYTRVVAPAWELTNDKITKLDNNPPHDVEITQLQTDWFVESDIIENARFQITRRMRLRLRGFQRKFNILENIKGDQLRELHVHGGANNIVRASVGFALNKQIRKGCVCHLYMGETLLKTIVKK